MKHMPMINKNLLRWAFLGLILAGTGVYFWDRKDLLAEASKISLLYIVLIVLSKYVVALLNGLKLRQSMRLIGRRLGYSEWFGLSASTTLFAYTLPFRTSVAPRMVYLKKHHKLGYSENAAITVGVNLLDTAFTALSGLFVVTFLLDLSQHNTRTIALGFAAASILALIAITGLSFASNHRFHFIPERLKPVLDRVSDALRAIGHFTTDHIALLFLMGLSLLARSVALYICFAAVGATVELSYLYVAICLVSITIVVSLTPGNIGITEGILVVVAVTVGVPIEYALPAVLLSRAGSLAVQIPLGIYYSVKLYGNWRPDTAGTSTTSTGDPT